jgi:hypothetical protein
MIMVFETNLIVDVFCGKWTTARKSRRGQFGEEEECLVEIMSVGIMGRERVSVEELRM